MKRRHYQQSEFSKWNVKSRLVSSTLNCLLVILFIVVSNTLGHSQAIQRAEYFIDIDPGNGNGTAVTVTTPGVNVNFSFPISTSSLSTGFHNLGFRFRESITGVWSHTQFNSFYIVPTVTLTSATTLTRGEYFFDADPGFENGIPLTFTAGPSIALSLSAINIGSLAPGFHTINFRFKDNRNRWTHTLVNSFYVIPPITTTAATSITQAEYFIDNDLGVGNNTALPITAGNPQSNFFPISLPGTLSSGFHKIGIRYRDNRNRWSHTSTQSFYILPPINTGSREIVAARYFLDDEQGSGTPISIPGITPGSTIDQLVALDMTGVPTGAHTLTIQVKDSEGLWSYLVTENFSVSACTPPPAPTAPAVNRCGSGILALTATGATGTQQYRWYNDPILNNLIFTGASFTTPTLSASAIYYVAIYDPNTDCESTRVAVNANVILFPKPTINPSGSLSICEGSSIFLTAPPGFSQYSWSNGQTTQQILVTSSGNYTVQTGDASCLSEPADAVSVVVIPAPQKPTITVTGNTTICGTGSVQLAGPAGFEYTWSNGATDQSITVAQTGVFYLIVRTAGANCPSLPSDPVVVTVLTPPCGVGNPTNAPPEIVSNPLASQIEGKVSVDLTDLISDPDNNIDFSTLRIVNNQTARGINASIDGSYFLQIDYSGNPFTGTDRVTLEVCDLGGLCVQQVIDIEVVGAVVVFNGLTPDGDGKNDFLFIKYIDVVEGAAQNRVRIFNRWGDVVFDVENYNNIDRIFTGVTTQGKDLPSGTYFYTIELSGNNKSLTGYITLIR